MADTSDTRTVASGGLEFVLKRTGKDDEDVFLTGKKLGSMTRTLDGTGFTWFSHSVHKRLFTSLPSALYDLYLCSEEEF